LLRGWGFLPVSSPPITGKVITMENNFYTYAFLRENGTPYYIGKGRGSRRYTKCGRRGCNPPTDKSRIITLKQNLTEEEAFRHEVYMIAIFGRKDLGTGILYNFTDGGEGVSGLRHADDSRARMSSTKRNKSDDEKRVTSEKLSIAAKTYFANLTEEEKIEFSAKVSEVHNKRTEEEKTKINLKRSKTLLNKTENEKAKIALKKQETLRNKTEQEKFEFSVKMSEVHKNRAETEKEEIASRISAKISKLRWYVNSSNESVRRQNSPGPGWKLGRIWDPTETPI
jgi:hypothetical protein